MQPTAPAVGKRNNKGSSPGGARDEHAPDNRRTAEAAVPTWASSHQRDQQILRFAQNDNMRAQNDNIRDAE
jgi:hypothetical protein